MTLPPEAPDLPERLVSRAGVLGSRDAILPLLPRGAVIAEVGVGLGDFSAALLAVCQPRQFVAIDNFALHHEGDLWGRTPAEVFGTRTHLDCYEARFAAPLRAGRMRILIGESADCLERVEDQSLDVIYIDADHRYEFVARDLAVAARKIRADGWIVVNDYIMVPTLGASIPYGVVHATHEFMLAHDWGMQYLALHSRMFCDVVLRPAALLGDEPAALRAEIAALRSSTSWRLTSPLRSAATMIRARALPWTRWGRGPRPHD